LLRLKVNRNPSDTAQNESKRFIIQTGKDINYRYSIITLNYDLIIETLWKSMVDRFTVLSSDRQLNNNIATVLEKEEDFDRELFYMAKLHGSISNPKSIMPPSWNKTITGELQPAWKLAHKLLQQAQHIRIIGYSLPITDAYIKYFLKYAVLTSQHLKKIDVICLDGDGQVRNRYGQFISSKLRFANETTEEYLKTITTSSTTHLSGRKNPYTYKQIETAHENFMLTHNQREPK
jgi:hypothetical protein